MCERFCINLSVRAALADRSRITGNRLTQKKTRTRRVFIGIQGRLKHRTARRRHRYTRVGVSLDRQEDRSYQRYCLSGFLDAIVDRLGVGDLLSSQVRHLVMREEPSRTTLQAVDIYAASVCVEINITLASSTRLELDHVGPPVIRAARRRAHPIFLPVPVETDSRFGLMTMAVTMGHQQVDVGCAFVPNQWSISTNPLS